jgi:hypothetical protein
MVLPRTATQSEMRRRRRSCRMARSDQGSLERPTPRFAVCFGGRPVHSRLERGAAADEASDAVR